MRELAIFIDGNWIEKIDLPDGEVMMKINDKIIFREKIKQKQVGSFKLIEETPREIFGYEREIGTNQFIEDD